MAATAFDSSVIVAAHLTWHERHEPAYRVLEETLAAGRPILPLHALVEAYSVLTRLPPPHRLSPADALGLISPLKGRMTIRGLGEDVWSLLESAPSRNIAGGAVYDAMILAEAAAAGATSFRTLNTSDFERFRIEGVAIEGV